MTLTTHARPFEEIRCELTELLLAQCGHCRGIEDPEVAKARRSALRRLERLANSEVRDDR